MNYNNPHHDWDDFQDRVTLTDSEESDMQDLILQMVEDDFQDVLFNATQVNDGYKERGQDLKEILKLIHNNSGDMKSYAALGEYLYLAAYDYADDSVTETFTRFE
tara:strand:- start:272 stop:586 length:315 start_codon:yes stop_codon:yes gene_type:complete